ncbi:MAG TPA: TylF/MycF/NovP-related O-methyltransferase [Planctomycetota bacterium]|nr:TylF/MycF/NovP-related O-methyltransferase [Planctomycetota bacterium]HRR78854.1 TylF/MycF/NovP-related O-methyltransferase [Planctomycetota bacterium]HRT92840.1 TylF/MycF/NovP-related O-methyltransferase [Planctomycetota bacterium]
MKSLLVRIIKHAQFLSPLRRYFFYRYMYQFAPAQLAFLCKCLDETKQVPGAVVEVGCGMGCTTVFLNRHMDFIGLEKPYICLDTFQGFTSEDVKVEVGERGKNARNYRVFNINSQKWFDGTMRSNKVTRVRSIKADTNSFDFGSLGRISFCLIDVDLYRPVRRSLNGVFPHMSPGGIIIVDDCRENTAYDGALQAYKEFVQSRGLPENISLRKLGRIDVA